MNEIENANTTDSLIAVLKAWSEKKGVVPAKDWLNVAVKLEILMLDDTVALTEADIALARKIDEIEKSFEKPNDARAKRKSKLEPEYKQWKDLDDKVKMIKSFILLAKRATSVHEFS